MQPTSRGEPRFRGNCGPLPRRRAAPHRLFTFTTWMLAVAATAFGANARAQTVALQWPAAEGLHDCISADRLTHQVEDILGSSVFAPRDTAAATLSGTVANERGRWTVHLTLTSATGETIGTREITRRAARCRSLDGTIAVVVVLLVRVAATHVPLELPDEEPEVEPATPAPSPSPRPSTAPVPPLPPARADAAAWQLLSGVSALGTAGFLPGLGASFAAGVDWHVAGWMDRWGALLDLRVYPGASTEGNGPAASFHAWDVGLAGCGAPLSMGRARLAACGGVRVGAIRALGLGLASAREAERPRVDLELSAVFDLLLLRPLYLTVRAGAFAMLLADAYYYRARGEDLALHEPWPVVPWVSVGLSLGSPWS